MKLRTLPQVQNRVTTVKQPLTFGGGINNTDPEEQTGRDQIVAGLNMFLDRTGGAYNRNGAPWKGTMMGATTGVLNLFNFTNNAGTQTFMAGYDTGLYYDNSEAWTAVAGITFTTNLRAEGVFFPSTNKFYIVNGTDNVAKITSTASVDQSDGSFKKGTWIESFDGRLITGGVSGQENRLWVTDLGVDTFTSSNWVDLEGKLLAGKELLQRLMLVWSDRVLYKIPGFASTPNASGPEGAFSIAKVGLVGTRAVTVHNKVAYYVAFDEQNTIEVYACDGQANIPIGSALIKDYLQGLAPGSLTNLCMIPDGQFIRLAATPTGATTNTREYLYDTINRKWMPEFRPGFPINCYARIKVSSSYAIYAGEQSLGIVHRLGSGMYDELVDQSYTTGQDADQNIAGSTTTRAAQGFKLSASATQTRVVTGGAILMKKNTGTTTGLTVRIETDNAGVPSGTLADSNLTTTIATFTDTSYVYRTFKFATPAALTGSTQYHLVVQHTTEGAGSSQYYVGVDSSSPTYASGALSTYASGTWTAVTGSDALFILFDEEYIESYITQTTPLDDVLHPKKTENVIIKARSVAGVTAKLGVGTEGKDSTFNEVDIALSGNSVVWASSSTDTTANRLVWAASSTEEGTYNKWTSGVNNYTVTVYPSPYLAESRYITYRFYFKGIGDFRINHYLPVYEVIPTTV